MASLHEELAEKVNLEEGEENLDTVEGFRKDVKRKISKFLCGIGSKEKQSPEEPDVAPSPSSSHSSTDFGQIKTSFIKMESHHQGGGDMDTDVYDFSFAKRGLAVIINNEDFSSSSDFDDRPGSAYDASALYHSFAHLGFDVLLYNNLAAWKMVEVLRAAARDYDHANADCFACSILTHGDQTWSNREYDRQGLTVRQDLLFGTDGKAVSTRSVVDLFSDRGSAGLKGKPRLFFLQACRGTKLDDGQDMHVVTPLSRNRRGRGARDAVDGTNNTEENTDSLDKVTTENTTDVTPISKELAQRQTSLSSSVDPPGFSSKSDMTDARPSADDEEMEESSREFSASDFDSGDEDCGQTSSVDASSSLWRGIREVPVSPAPIYKDCLVMYATPPGHFAWRRKNGAWFIQSLCKVLSSRHLENLSLTRALVQVSGFVAKNYQSENPSRPDMHAKKEMPVIESMLVKDVFLTKKHRI